MLLSGSSSSRATQLALWCCLSLYFGTLAYGQRAGIAGSMPEDHLPGLRGLLETALKQSPEVLQQRFEIEDAEARVYLEGYQRWPTVGGDIRYTSNEEAISGNESTSSRASGLFYSLSANQALFYWGEIRNRTRAAKIGVLIAEKNFSEAYRTIATEIRRLYLGLVFQHAVLVQSKHRLAMEEAALAGTREQQTRGLAAVGEVLNRELLVETLQLDVARAQNRFDSERRRLARIAGLDEIPAEQIPFVIPEPNFRAALAEELVAEFLRDGAASSFRVQIAEMGIKQADLRYRIARVRLLPKFSTSIGYSRDSYTNATPDRLSQTAITRQSIDVRGNWSIFDGFATRGAKLQAKAERRQWERRLKAWSDAAMDEAQTLERSVRIEARAMQLASRRREGAAAAVRLAEEEAKAGRRAELELERARNQLFEAEAAEAAARAAFLSEWAALVSRVSEDPILNALPPRYVSSTR